LSTTHAGCHNTIFFIQSFHVLRNLDRQLAARAAQWVTQRDSSSIRIHDGRVDLQLADNGKSLGGEGFVQLHQVDLAKVHPCLFQRFWDGLYRSDAHDARMHAGTGAGYQSGYRRQAQLFHHFFSHDDHKGRAIAGLGRIPCRHAATGGKDGLQMGQRFQRGVGAGTFVRIHGEAPFLPPAFFIDIDLLHVDGKDALFKMPFLDGVYSFLMGMIRELVLVFPADLVFFGHRLGGKPHIEIIIRVFGGDGISGNRLPPCGRHHAHAFRSTRDNAFGLTGTDLRRSDGDRLKAAGAIAVHRNSGGMDAHGARGDDTPYLQALFSLGHGVADDHIVHAMRVELWYGGQQPFDEVYRQIVRPVKPELPSFRFSHCGAITGNYIGFLHKNIFILFGPMAAVRPRRLHRQLSISKIRSVQEEYKRFFLSSQHFMYKFLRNLLFLFPAEGVHHFSMKGLKWACRLGFLRRLVALTCRPEGSGLVREVFGLSFRNPVGLGAGFDKNALYLRELEALGFGFVEIGTVTPLAQAGNDQPRLFRLRVDQALINRMGFNNDGVNVIAGRLKKWKDREQRRGAGDRKGRRTGDRKERVAVGAKEQRADDPKESSARPPMIIGGNIGKNKSTPNEEAWKDYEICFRGLYGLVDYFVVNVSSPNTPGLRELQEKESLRRILVNLQEINQELSRARSVRPVPLLLKISPDLSRTQIDDVIGLALEIKLDGLVAANTTIGRDELLSSPARLASIGAGGLSGAPLRERSTALVRYIYGKTKGAVPLIASGGIFTGGDAKEKISAGASLVQVWTGFIYEGPFITLRICRELGH